MVRTIDKAILVEDLIGLFYNPKKNTWYVRLAAEFDFTRAKRSCPKCYGTGKSGYARVTMTNEKNNRPFPARIHLICPKCRERMKKDLEEIAAQKLEEAPEKLAPNSSSDGRSPGPEGKDQGDSKLSRLTWLLALAALGLLVATAFYCWR